MQAIFNSIKLEYTHAAIYYFYFFQKQHKCCSCD